MFENNSYNYRNITREQRTALISIETYAEGFLRFVPREIRNFPSHGIDHSFQIIHLINEFKFKWNLNLTKNEQFILYLAAWLHDIGRIRNNDGPHSEKSVEILLKSEILCNLLNNIHEDILICLCHVIKSHSSAYKISKVPEYQGNIRVRLISAIFRLLDACEVTNLKCPQWVFEEIKDTFVDENGNVDVVAIQFWESHMNIKGLSFERPLITIVINKENREKTQKVIGRLKKEIRSIHKVFSDNKIEVPKVKEF